MWHDFLSVRDQRETSHDRIITNVWPTFEHDEYRAIYKFTPILNLDAVAGCVAGSPLSLSVVFLLISARHLIFVFALWCSTQIQAVSARYTLINFCFCLIWILSHEMNYTIALI